MSRSGFVYAVEDASGRCRIGKACGTMLYTDGLRNSINRNLRYSPNKTWMIFSIFHHRCESMEEVMHHHFEQSRTNGDWFEITKDQIIESLPDVLTGERLFNEHREKIATWIKSRGLTLKEIQRMCGITSWDAATISGNGCIKYSTFVAVYSLMTAAKLKAAA